jgi:integrase
LEFARGYDLNICRALAVRYFAGLRSSEVAMLEEKEIHGEFIEVTAAKSKTRRRRLVTVQPVLAAWLDLGGSLPVKGNKSNVWRDFTAALARETGVPWHHNVTRHSFVSYHLARFQNAGKTALESGHSEQMLFAHYREVVTRPAAKDFWALFP